VLFAGEVFPTQHLRELAATLQGVELCNLYGPTETNVITWYRVPALAPDRDDPIPIGRACANTDLLIVAEDGRLVTEPGLEGELLARGPTVAQGYWGDAEKTGRVFVQNPFQPAYRDIVYHTGDIVSRAPDGNLLFLGRRDRMVKVRGYRIELDEIEATLYGHPDVKEAAVVALPDEEHGARIRAFLACGGDAAASLVGIREHCLGRLPRYMVPESFEILDQLPKTSTGKIDRTQLAARA
jgi:acyl-CoA synthetase (AMP-forming)/AMP-acid ligase II